MPRPRKTDYTDQVELLLEEAQDLPHGATRIELCEEAIRIADSHNDLSLAYQARDELVESACFGARPDLLIVTFSWCLSTFDRHPEADISEYQLLWRMKWVVSALPDFPQIKLATIHQMLDDMERRFRNYGESIQPVLGKRRSVALQTGDLEGARAFHRQFARMQRTILSDCHACELDALACYWFDIGRYAHGIRKAEELIASGMSCARVPAGTYADLLLPMLRTGRGEDAMVYHKKGYPKIRRDTDYMWHWGQHLSYLALTGNDARAAKLIETHLPVVESAHDPLSMLEFLRNMLLALECIAERKEKIKLRLPAESPLANESGEYLVAELAEKTRKRVTEMSKRFDQRNGNSYYRDLIDELPRLRKYATHIPSTR
jgi:cellulose synthase operon protein C